MNHWKQLLCGICILMLGALPLPAHAQTYPTKPVRIIIPFAPGGGADYIARPLGPKLMEALGQPVILDNRGGANGAIGADIALKAAPDGYTLFFGSAGVLTIGPALNPALNYVPERDFLPIALMADIPFSLIVHSSLPTKTAKELVAYARANPGKLKYGVSGIGGAPHLAGELLNITAKVDTLHVNYKGVGPMLTDLLAGRLDMTFVGLNTVRQHVTSGKLVALATTGDRRSPFAPDLPTLAEAGLSNFKAGTWYGVLALAGTPRPIIQRLNTELNRVLAGNDFKELLAATGAEPANNTPEQFGQFLKEERQRWERVIKAADIKLEP